MPSIGRRPAAAAAFVLCWAGVCGAQPTAQADEREAASLVDQLAAKMDRWERRPAERAESEQDIQGDLDRLGAYYQSGFGSMLGRRGFSWRSRRLLDRSHVLFGRATGFGSRNPGFNTSLAGAMISFGGVLGQPGARNLGRPRAAAAVLSRAGLLLGGVRRSHPGFSRGATLLGGLDRRMSSFDDFGWYNPGLYGYSPAQGARDPQPPKRTPLPDRTLGEAVDEYLGEGRAGIAEAIANMPGGRAPGSLDELLNRYGSVEDKAGAMWASVSELHYRLAAEGHRLRAETVAWVGGLQVGLEEAAAGLDASDADRADEGLRRAEFELARLARVVGR